MTNSSRPSTASAKRGAEAARGPEMVKQRLAYDMKMIAVGGATN